MTSITHDGRASLAARDGTYTLRDGALHWREGAAEGDIPYGDICLVSLIAYASTGGEQAQCLVRSRGGRTLKIRSHHYRSLGNFEDRTASYSPFVRGLCARVAAANPDARFVTGSTGLWIVSLVSLGLVGALLVILAAMLGSGASVATVGAVGALVVLGVGGPVLWRQVRRGGAQGFDPANPPVPPA